MLQNRFFRLAASVVLSAGVIAALPGCTDQQISDAALIIGAVAIGASAATGGLDQPPRHDHGGWDHHDGGGRDDGGGRRDDHGGWGRRDDHGGGGFDRRDGGQPRQPMSNFAAPINVAAFKAPAFVSNDQRVIQLAHNYDISQYAATYVVRAIVLAQAKDTSGIKELGLDVADFKKIFDGQPIANEKVDSLASKLKLERPVAAQLVVDLSQDIRAEKAARGL